MVARGCPCLWPGPGRGAPQTPAEVWKSESLAAPRGLGQPLSSGSQGVQDLGCGPPRSSESDPGRPAVRRTLKRKPPSWQGSESKAGCVSRIRCCSAALTAEAAYAARALACGSGFSGARLASRSWFRLFGRRGMAELI